MALGFDAALRACEVLMAIAFVQQSSEHLLARGAERAWSALRIALALMLIGGVTPLIIECALLVLGLLLLWHFQGPYNGGSDRLSLLMLVCLLLARVADVSFATATATATADARTLWRDVAFGYLAVQLVLSYVLAGWAKLRNADWRSGQALTDVFAWSAYPVSEGLRVWGRSRGLMLAASWCVILFELLFPLALFNQHALLFALVAATLFHLANALLFGLNRFFWIWLAAYPALVWFQQRVA